MMKLSEPTCPECGEPAIGTVDRIPGIAMFHYVPGGYVEWTGDTHIDWDGQQTEEIDGLSVVKCVNGHEWTTEITEV